MIESVRCQNFKVLRNVSLSLGPFTLLVGPNGSGKSTLLQALAAGAFVSNPHAQQAFNMNPVAPNFLFPINYPLIASAGSDGEVHIDLVWDFDAVKGITQLNWRPNGQIIRRHASRQGGNLPSPTADNIDPQLARLRFFSLDPLAIGVSAAIRQGIELGSNGTGLPAVLDNLDDEFPERFEALNEEMCKWLPEYDRIVFEKQANQQGHKSIALRTREGNHKIPASQLSHGTLFALVLLTLAYLPNPPALIAFEEVDRGIHARLFRDLQTALYRLTDPNDFGDRRPAVQVVATTHSPYLLDLYKDHPEQIVIAHRKGNAANFERLSDRPDIEEILGSAPLGEVWYSGILGGVPGEP